MAISLRSNGPQLPIEEHLEAILAGIAEHRITLLQASPGSGKTTILPLALAQQPWIKGQKILVLQPRRLAAKAVALRMAELLGEPVGETVGYRVRLESCVSERTRIEVLTEGLLTRRLISEPELHGVAAIVFDEFHERTVHADVGLALAQEVANVLRNDLRIVVMSATLGDAAQKDLFCDAFNYSFEGTPYPVSTEYRSADQKAPIWERAASAARDALLRYSGDILIFLPGAYEIKRTQQRLEEILSTANAAVKIMPLFGDLPYSEQKRAILPLQDGTRKIVLSTPIAETSLTIEGVCVVIDSGLHKVARSDQDGVVDLRTERITKDAADQRAGRAGRTAPGTCIRLWSEHEHVALRPAREPEVLRADITSTLLDLATWGVRSFEHFSWITSPSSQSIKLARELLIKLGALNPDGSVTQLGTTLASIGTDPRLGVMLLQARSVQREETAAALIAVLENRDYFAKSDAADLGERIEALNDLRIRDPHTMRLRDLKKLWQSRAARLPKLQFFNPAPNSTEPATLLGLLIASAFPGRIARRRAPGSHRYLLSDGRGAALRADDPLKKHEYIAVAALREGADDAWITLAAELREELFTGPLGHLLSKERLHSFDPIKGSLNTRIIEKIGAVTVREQTHLESDPGEMRDALLEWLATTDGFARLPFSNEATELRTRVAWLRESYPSIGWPDLSDTSLATALNEWLAPFLPTRPSLPAISSELLDTALSSLTPWSTLRAIDEHAPASITLPSGRSRRLVYQPGSPPVLEATIQELFGWGTTPLLGPGKRPVLIHLLSPARRAMQVTQDLAGFWINGYPPIRKELRGRYPKHRWPEDPLRG